MKTGQTVFVITEAYAIESGKLALTLPYPYVDGIGWIPNELVFETREAAEIKLTEMINEEIKQLESRIQHLKTLIP